MSDRNIYRRSPRPIKFGISREAQKVPSMPDKPWRNGMRKTNAHAGPMPVRTGVFGFVVHDRERKNQLYNSEGHAYKIKNDGKIIRHSNRLIRGSRATASRNVYQSVESLMSNILDMVREERVGDSHKSRTVLHSLLLAVQRALDQPQNRDLRIADSCIHRSSRKTVSRREHAFTLFFIYFQFVRIISHVLPLRSTRATRNIPVR
jgi:hypothetical protein